MRTQAERRRDIRDKISEWTHGPDWKTWIAHTVFAVIIALVVGLIAYSVGHGAEFYGIAVAIGYYLIREIEQTIYAFVDKKPIHWFDNIMDVAVPSAFLLVIAGIFYLFSLL